MEFTDVNGVNEGAYVIGYKNGVPGRAGNIIVVETIDDWARIDSFRTSTPIVASSGSPGVTRPRLNVFQQRDSTKVAVLSPTQPRALSFPLFCRLAYRRSRLSRRGVVVVRSDGCRVYVSFLVFLYRCASKETRHPASPSVHSPSHR